MNNCGLFIASTTKCDGNAVSKQGGDGSSGRVILNYEDNYSYLYIDIYKEASLVYGTCRKWLWLLRSRPDQVGHATMRRGPPTRILTAKAQSVLCVCRDL